MDNMMKINKEYRNKISIRYDESFAYYILLKIKRKYFIGNIFSFFITICNRLNSKYCYI